MLPAASADFDIDDVRLYTDCSIGHRLSLHEAAGLLIANQNRGLWNLIASLAVQQCALPTPSAAHTPKMAGTHWRGLLFLLLPSNLVLLLRLSTLPELSSAKKFGKPRLDEEGVMHDQTAYTNTELVGLCIVFIPLGLWLMLCLHGAADWLRNGRPRKNKDWLENRGR